MAVQRRPDGTTRGGNEPPDEVQDTPRQNAGYDAAVKGVGSDEVADPEADTDGPADDAATGSGDDVPNRFRPPADVPRRSGAGG